MRQIWTWRKDLTPRRPNSRFKINIARVVHTLTIYPQPNSSPSCETPETTCRQVATPPEATRRQVAPGERVADASRRRVAPGLASSSTTRRRVALETTPAHATWRRVAVLYGPYGQRATGRTERRLVVDRRKGWMLHSQCSPDHPAR